MSENTPFRIEVIQFLEWGISHHPEELEIIPWAVRDAVRQNDKRPAMTKIVTPDSWVMNINGDKRLWDTYISIRIPGEMFSEWNALKESSATQRSLFDQSLLQHLPPDEAPPAPRAEDTSGLGEGPLLDGVHLFTPPGATVVD
jgi:hypothetical protein